MWKGLALCQNLHVHRIFHWTIEDEAFRQASIPVGHHSRGLFLMIVHALIYKYKLHPLLYILFIISSIIIAE